MNEIILIRLKTFFRSIIAHDLKSFVRLLTYFCVISVFLYFNYFIFYKIFSFLLQSDPEIGYSITQRLVSIMFSTFFIMLMMSSVVTSVTTFFRTPELEFLFTTPINPKKIFIIKLIENGIFASWATLMISIPLMLALSRAFAFGAGFTLKSTALFLTMVFIAVSVGVFISFMLSEFFRKKSIGNIIITVVLVLVIIIIAIFFMKSSDLFNLPRNADLYEAERFISSLEVEQFKYLPSGIVIEMIFNKRMDRSNLFYLMLLTAYLIPTIAATFIFMKLYSSKYVSYEKTSRRSVKHKNRMDFPTVFRENRIALLMQKDMLVFLRDPSQWGQSVTFLLLLLFYGISIVRSPIYFKTPFYTYILAFANIGFSTYIMATLSVRFIFPLISLEGRTFSLIKSSVNIRDYFNAKLVFNFIVISVLGQILIVGTNAFLSIDRIVVLVSMVVTFIVSFGITIINTGIGALLPEFTETNPSKIASGFGGIISAISSLAYIGLTLGILSNPTKTYFEYAFKRIEFNNVNFFYAIAVVFIITMILFVFLYSAALKSLRKRSL
ncbi:MAG: putative ABC exporter domain-containing protein [bacterium]